jgi:hypothetical protein
VGGVVVVVALVEVGQVVTAVAGEVVVEVQLIHLCLVQNVFLRQNLVMMFVVIKAKALLEVEMEIIEGIVK